MTTVTKPVPEHAAGIDSVTPADEIEQLKATVAERERECRRLRSSLQLVSDALDLEKWDARWTNRLMQAHVVVRDTLDQVKAPPPR